MMIRTLRFLVCLTFLGWGCGPSGPTHREQRKPDVVAAEQLVDAYAAGRRHYDNRIVQIYLAAGEYRIRNGRIEGRLCGPHETIRFHAMAVPPEGPHLLITGTCRGTVRDGVGRCTGGRVTWFVLVEGCTVTTLGN